MQQSYKKPKEADLEKMRRQTHLGFENFSACPSASEFAQQALHSASGGGSAFDDVGMLLGDVRMLQQNPAGAEESQSPSGKGSNSGAAGSCAGAVQESLRESRQERVLAGENLH